MLYAANLKQLVLNNLRVTALPRTKIFFRLRLGFLYMKSRLNWEFSKIKNHKFHTQKQRIKYFIMSLGDEIFSLGRVYTVMRLSFMDWVNIEWRYEGWVINIYCSSCGVNWMKMNLKNLAELRVEMSRCVVRLRMTKQNKRMGWNLVHGKMCQYFFCLMHNKFWNPAIFTGWKSWFVTNSGKFKPCVLLNMRCAQYYVVRAR